MREDDTSDGTSQPEVTNTVFLAAAAKNVPPEDSLWLAHFIGDPGKASGNWGGQPYKPEHHERREADDSTWALQNTYFAVSSIRPGADGVLARRLTNMGIPLALVVDDAKVENLLGTPSWVTRTSPGKNQIGIFLDITEEEIPVFIELSRRMSKAGMMGHDTSGNNAVRYVRLPVGMNLKPRDTGPCRVEMQVWNPEQRMSLADAAAVFGFDLPEISADEGRAARPQAGLEDERRGVGDSEGSRGHVARLAGLIQDVLSGNSLHDPTMQLCASLVALGTVGGGVVNHVQAIMDASLAPRDERWLARYKDVPRLVKQAEEKFRREITPDAPKTRVPALSGAARGLPTVADLTDETVGMGLMLPVRTRTPGAPAAGAGVQPAGEAQGVAPGVALQTPPEALGEPAVLMAGTCAPAAPAAVPWVQPSQPVVVQVEPARPYFVSGWEMVSRRNRTEWLVHKYLQTNCLSLFFGQSGSGKSFVALDIGASVALGLDWHGRPTKQGTVIYVCGEGFEGLDRRLTAFYMHRKIPEAQMRRIPFYRTEKRVNITDHAKVQELADYIAETQALNGGGPIALVQIDTFNRNFEGDENTQVDVSKFFDNVNELILYRFKCHVMIVHHSGHGQDRARGSSVLRATVDQEFQVKSPGPGMVSIECTKMKDGSEPAKLVFDMKPVDIIEDTEDEDGETNVALELHGDPLDVIACQPKDRNKPGVTYKKLLELARRSRDTGSNVLAAEVSLSPSKLRRSFKACVELGLLVKRDGNRPNEAYWEISESGLVKFTKAGDNLDLSKAKRKGKPSGPVQDIDYRNAKDQSGDGDEGGE